MKVIIAGSRTITDYMEVDLAMQRMIEHEGKMPTEIISGCAPGVDTLGEEWAKKNGVPCTRMPAEWVGPGAIKDPSAGRRRNVAMAKYAGKGAILVAVMVAEGSPGTKHMINAAKARGLNVIVAKVGATT